MVTVGGMSKPDGSAVLVTAGGKEVGSADVAGEKKRRKKRRSSRSRARARAEAARLAELKSIEEEQKKREQELKIQKEKEAIEKTEKFRAIIRERQTKQELEKIKNARDRILKLGGRTRTQNLKNKKGNKIFQKTTFVDKIVNGEKIKERVFESTNLDTGETSIKRFEIKNGKTKKVGSIDFVNQSLSRKQSLLTREDQEKFIKEYNESIKKLNIPKENEGRVNKVVREFLEKNLKILEEGQKRRQLKYDEKRQTFVRPNGVLDAEYEKLKREIKRTGTTLSLLVGAGITTIVQNIKGFNDLRVAAPGLFKELIKEPKKALKVPEKIYKGIKREGKDLILLAQTSPVQFVGRLGGELVTFGGTGKILKVTGKTSSKVINKIKNLDPRLLKIQAGLIDLGKRGDNLVLRVGSIADIKESLSKQIKRSGKKVVAVTAQADKIPQSFFQFVKRKSVIRKPIPDENLLSLKTKRLLKQFDRKKLNLQ